MPTVADLECAVLRAGALTGSLSDMRRAYALQADPTDTTPNMSVSDARKAWWRAGAADDPNSITELERRYYLGSAVVYGPKNSVSDLRYEKFGGSVA